MSSKITDTGRKGDLEVWFEHGRKEGSSRTQPMIRIRNPVQKRSFLVYMDDAWMWDVRDASDGARVMIKAMEACEFLYDIPTKAGAIRVIDIMTEWMQDLLTQAPAPQTSIRELHKQLERDRVVVELNGEVLVDAR